MSREEITSLVVRVPTRVCLLCHALTEAGQYLLAVVGTHSFTGYSQSFSFPAHETRSGIKLYQVASETHISVCCPESCLTNRFPFCCRFSPHIAFLFQTECVHTLQNASKFPMHRLWRFASCVQPSYVDFRSVSTTHQKNSVIASLRSTDLALFPPAISSILKRMQALAPELLCLILDFAVPSLSLSLTTVLLDTLPLLQRTRTLNFHNERGEVDCRENIYVHYVKVRGKIYLSEISNTYRNGMTMLPVLAKNDRIIISVDDLGVCGVCFSTQKCGVKPTKAPWYQFKDVKELPDYQFFPKCNPILVTEIALGFESPAEYVWDCPEYPDIPLRQWYAYEKSAPMLEIPFRMRRVDLSGNISGLSVSHGSWSNMSFHAHDKLSNPSKPSPSEVEYLYGKRLVWMCFPISAGEKICGVWVRSLLGGLATVAIYTNLGRSRIFSPVLRDEFRPSVSIRCLSGSLDGHVTSLYYNDVRPKSTKKDLRLAIASKEGVTSEVPENLPWPSIRLPEAFRINKQHWFHSQATLECVQTIDICRDKTNGTCLGILLHYENCTREVLGQWRFDYPIEVMAERDAPCVLHIQSAYLENIPCVQNISFDSDVEGPGWITIHMKGHLTWWFSETGGCVMVEENT